jgi:peroxiredoxin
MALETGKRFPEFKLQNQDGKTVTLDDYSGKWLVVYVYPKDDTPGCRENPSPPQNRNSMTQASLWSA